jgi:hypothetical protein
MKCYRCQSDLLPLAPLSEHERQAYPTARMVLRICQQCGLAQSHAGDDEPLTPSRAAKLAPSGNA